MVARLFHCQHRQNPFVRNLWQLLYETKQICCDWYNPFRPSFTTTARHLSETPGSRKSVSQPAEDVIPFPCKKVPRFMDNNDILNEAHRYSQYNRCPDSTN